LAQAHIAQSFPCVCRLPNPSVMTRLGAAWLLCCLLCSAPALRAGSGAVFHPGHAPLHVTRLHRYEHAGLDSMLEAEERWHFETRAQESRRKGSMRGSSAVLESSSSAIADPEPFVKMSDVQIDALRDHHASWLQQRSTRIRKADGLQQQEGSLGRMQPSNVLTEAVRKYHGHKPEGNEAATRLSSVSSQYVGPIGVGTVARPLGCNVNQDQDVKYMQWEDVRAQTQHTGNLTGEQCHIEDESQVWVVFDTGSTNIWVASDLCKDGPCTKAGRHRYNHTRSITYASPESPLDLSVQFGTGSVTGPHGVDDFHIGPFAVFNQTFALMEVQQGNVFEQVPFEGILGLAFKSMSANHAMPFFDNIVNQQALNHNEFAIYFSLDDVTSNGIFWGGVDQAFFKGPIEYFPITDPYYWATDLHSFKIGNEELIGIARAGADNNTQQTVRALVDTGTTFFTAEDGLFQEVMARLSTVRCGNMTEESHPPITYTLQRTDGAMKDFVLKKHQYMTSAGTGAGATCSPGFMKINIPKEHGPAMVLGECFLRQYYSVFDRVDGKPENAQVGFALSEHGAQAKDTLRKLAGKQTTFGSQRSNSKSFI